MRKFATDYERLETVKAYKASKLTVSEYARRIGINRTTLRDWVNAYDNIDGAFVRLNKVIESDSPETVLSNSDVTVKMIDTDTIIKKSSHFSRFDHSIVVIEFNKIKVTTSLEQALQILEKYYDRH